MKAQSAHLSLSMQAGTNYLLINGQLVDVVSLDFFKVLQQNITPSAATQPSRLCACPLGSVCTSVSTLSGTFV